MGRIPNAPKTVPFHRDGNIAVTFVDCEIADSKWVKPEEDPNAFDICLKVKADDSDECDWWYGECSGRYGKGNNAGKTQFQITMEVLEKLGIQNGDVSQIFNLIGKKTVAWIKKIESNGKDYFNVASVVSSAFEPKAIDPNDLNRRVAALMNPQPQTAGVGAGASWGTPPNNSANPFASKK